MKTIIKNTLVLALMVFASAASYANGVDTAIRARGEKLFSVYHNATGEFHFTVKDQSGKVVYYIKGNKKNKFAKTFDVKNLPIGNYILEAKDASIVSTYVLKIKSTGLDINKDQDLALAK